MERTIDDVLRALDARGRPSPRARATEAGYFAVLYRTVTARR
jgi:hypothetical protein